MNFRYCNCLFYENCFLFYVMMVQKYFYRKGLLFYINKLIVVQARKCFYDKLESTC